MEKRILPLYQEMHKALESDKGLIPSGNYHTVRFEELERNPLGELQSLYESLRLGDPPFNCLKKYLSDIRHYKKNNYPELKCAERNRVTEAWGPWLRDWGYA